jgi:hypothetical protein
MTNLDVEDITVVDIKAEKSAQDEHIRELLRHPCPNGCLLISGVCADPECSRGIHGDILVAPRNPDIGYREYHEKINSGWTFNYPVDTYKRIQDPTTSAWVWKIVQ